MATPLAVRAASNWWRRERRALPTAIGVGLLLPLGYLASLGLGIGRYVGGSGAGGAATSAASAWLGGVRYVAWLAPGLLAGTAVQTAGAECLWPVYGAVKWSGQYVAQTATPLRARDAFAGHWLYVAGRMALSAALQLAVMAGFGAWRRPTAPLALLAAVLCGAAVAAWFMGHAVTRKVEDFALVQRFLVAPMFLFSGTFFPVTRLPVAVRWIVYATPLYHGVTLCRGLMLPGTSGAALAASAGYLAVLLAVGLAVTGRRYARVLSR